MYDLKLPQPLLWKDVFGFEGVYLVSNYGTIKSVDRYVQYMFKGVEVTRLFKGKVLKPKYDKDGYESYGLSFCSNRKDVRGHRIVAEAFISNTRNLPVVDHKNGNVRDNVVWNLQWMTTTQNTIKFYAQEANLGVSLSALSKEDWKYVRFLYEAGISYKAIVTNIGIDAKDPTTLWEGLSGKRLSSVTGIRRGEVLKREPTNMVDKDVVFLILRDRLLHNQPLRELSNKYNLSVATISRYCSGKRSLSYLEEFKRVNSNV
jgi:hypothetical protein